LTTGYICGKLLGVSSKISKEFIGNFNVYSSTKINPAEYRIWPLFGLDGKRSESGCSIIPARVPPRQKRETGVTPFRFVTSARAAAKPAFFISFYAKEKYFR
jgi:hypothetical protein